jgi:hypothetical protein
MSGLVSGSSGQAVNALSVFGAALGAYAIGREQMTQDRRSAERYDRTFSALTALAERFDRVRDAVAQPG